MSRRVRKPLSPKGEGARGRPGKPAGAGKARGKPAPGKPATGKPAAKSGKPFAGKSVAAKSEGKAFEGRSVEGKSFRPRSEERPARGRSFEERGAGERSFGGKPARPSGKPPRRRDDDRAAASFRGEGRRVGNTPQPASSRGRPARHDERPARDEAPEKPAAAALPTSVQTVTVTADENGMRVDRFLEARFPGLSFSHIQRIVRKGELRVNGKRADSKDRLAEGQSVRIPPLRLDAPKVLGELSEAQQKTRDALKAMTLWEDDDVLVLNKPAGLAVQGGSGTTRHVDQMLEVLRDAKGQRPRLVHRLDKETSGCLLIAKTRFAASTLAGSFRSRSARKIYWALVAGVPKPRQGRISTFLAKEEREDDSVMRIAEHGDEGASHAVTYYAVVETSAQKLAWVSLKPVTGRTHQLRAHMDHIGHPIVGDPKYFNIENWELPGGIQNRLHLLARRIVIPHPRGGLIDATAPLPPHMQQSWNLLGLEADRFDPIEEAPEE
jgi:23S rRNA pseudouridine955/2504/2580 synthase